MKRLRFAHQAGPPDDRRPRTRRMVGVCKEASEMQRKDPGIEDCFLVHLFASSLCSASSSLTASIRRLDFSFAAPLNSRRVLTGTRNNPSSISTNSTLLPCLRSYFLLTLEGIVTMPLLVTVATSPIYTTKKLISSRLALAERRC